MEREIIFRGKRPDTGEWVYGGIAHKGRRVFIITIAEWRPDTRDWDMAEYYETHPRLKAEMIEVNPATVGQYTGLKDKNGKKIFEGDVVKWDEKEWPNFSELVRWDYELLDMRKNDWPQFCEVIGNRWDNPELFGGEDMKFRDPETGEVFDNIKDALEHYCPAKDDRDIDACKRCAIGSSKKTDDTICTDFSVVHPTEAARLMGYEVIDDTPTTLDDTQIVSGDRQTDKGNIVLGKPLREWTLGEALDFCHRDDSFCTRGEEECPFFRTVCQERVADWGLQKGVDACSVNPETPKADTTDKPRLAEVLGVEEDEMWIYPGLIGPYRVHDGIRQYLNEEGNWFNCSNEVDFAEIINNPERIIRAPAPHRAGNRHHAGDGGEVGE